MSLISFHFILFYLKQTTKSSAQFTFLQFSFFKFELRAKLNFECFSTFEQTNDATKTFDSRKRRRRRKIRFDFLRIIATHSKHTEKVTCKFALKKIESFFCAMRDCKQQTENCVRALAANSDLTCRSERRSIFALALTLRFIASNARTCRFR